MSAPHRQPRAGTNTSSNNAYQATMSIAELDMWYQRIPAHIRHWLEYDAAVPFNPQNIWEYRHSNPFFPKPWGQVFAELKVISLKAHRNDFGGVHPSIDTPRQVW